MEEYLFIVSLGPVQVFIESARRTRDLAFGSWFLSELSRAAARAIVDQNSLESLIFPAPDSRTKLESRNKDFVVANKLIAIVQQDPATLGELVRKAIWDELETIRKKAFSWVDVPENIAPEGVWFPGKKIPDAALAQIHDLPEYIWVALPYRPGAYQQTRKQLEVLLGARKNTQNFAAVDWAASVPKSSLGGELEGIIPEGAYPRSGDSADDKKTKLRELYEYYGAGPAEQLSGVDMLKRRGSTAYSNQFPSTSHMAALPFLHRLENLSKGHLAIAQPAWEAYIAIMKRLAFSPYLEQTPHTHPVLGNYDGSLLLESRLVDVLYAPGEKVQNQQFLHQAQQALHDFYDVLDKQCQLQGARPGPYYAFLQADGDGMGEIIDAEAVRGHQQHQQVSRKLAVFAAQVRGIVRKHRGEPVYAGGDDILALLPLETMLVCASELARTFQDLMREFADKKGRRPSLSAGIAIVHHLESLRQVRKLAKESEMKAKNFPQKNALCITLSRRSGEDYRVVGHWGDLDAMLTRLTGYCRQDAIPGGTPYELREMAVRLGLSLEPEGSEDDRYSEVVKLDAMRILKRKFTVPPDKFSKEQREKIERVLSARLGLEQKPHPDIVDILPVSLNELIYELIIAQTLADAAELVSPSQRKKENTQV